MHLKGEVGTYKRLRAKIGSGFDRKGYRVLHIGGREYKEHRLVMERFLGRPLMGAENVHHIDGDRANNDLSNLELWVKTQPCGQRAEDKVKAAIKLLQQYPDLVEQEGFRLVAEEDAWLAGARVVNHLDRPLLRVADPLN